MAWVEAVTAWLEKDGRADSPELRLREERGETVRNAWIEWAREQDDPKESWLTPWHQLGEGQREVDMRIAEAVLTAERNRQAQPEMGQ